MRIHRSVALAGGLAGLLLAGAALAEGYFVRRGIKGIVPPNPPPVWVTGPALPGVAPGGAVSITLLAEDPKGDTVTYALGSGSSLPGGISLDGNTLTGTGPADGTYLFTIVATDPENQAAGREFTLISDDLPAFSGSADLGDFAAGVTNDLSASITANDADGIATYRIIGDAHGLSIDSGGSLTGTPPGAGGAYVVTIEAEDNGGATAQRDYSFHANRAPYFSAPSGTDLGDFLTGQTVTVNLTVVDPDGDDITLTSVNKPSPSGSWKYDGVTATSKTVASGSTVVLTGQADNPGSGQSVTDRLDDGRGTSNSVVTRSLTLDAAYPADCNALHAAIPSLGDGSYTIDPDGAGGDAAFSAWCNMSVDDGGWTLIRRVVGAEAWPHDDNFTCSVTEGTYQASSTVNAQFGLDFCDFTFTEVLFMSGDEQEWMSLDKTQLVDLPGVTSPRADSCDVEVTQVNAAHTVTEPGSIPSGPYLVANCRRPITTDPQFSIHNHFYGYDRCIAESLPPDCFYIDSQYHSMLWSDGPTTAWNYIRLNRNGQNMYIR